MLYGVAKCPCPTRCTYALPYISILLRTSSHPSIVSSVLGVVLRQRRSFCFDFVDFVIILWLILFPDIMPTHAPHEDTAASHQRSD